MSHESMPPHDETLSREDLIMFTPEVAFANLATANERLRNERDTDAKTGLLSSAGLEAATLRTLEENPGARLLIFEDDLGNFKTINDTLGHEFGDKVLKLFADKKKELLREGDLLSHDAREQGDEFYSIFILGAEVKEKDIPIAIKRIQDRIHSIREKMVGELPELAQFESFNIATSGVEYNHSLSFAQNKQLADVEMYLDKAEQREKYGDDRQAASILTETLGNMVGSSTKHNRRSSDAAKAFTAPSHPAIGSRLDIKL